MIDPDLFFAGWSGIVRTLVVGALAYLVLIALLRVSGRRTLSRMNAFDAIVTFAIGSTLAAILVNPDLSLAEGAAALFILIALQSAVTFSSVRSPLVRKIVTGEPQMLFYRGQFIGGLMRSARVTEDEVKAAIRSEGLGDMEEVEAVVLETNGTLSVITKGERSASTLTDVSS